MGVTLCEDRHLAGPHPACRPIFQRVGDIDDVAGLESAGAALDLVDHGHDQDVLRGIVVAGPYVDTEDLDFQILRSLCLHGLVGGWREFGDHRRSGGDQQAE